MGPLSIVARDRPRERPPDSFAVLRFPHGAVETCISHPSSSGLRLASDAVVDIPTRVFFSSGVPKRGSITLCAPPSPHTPKNNRESSKPIERFVRLLSTTYAYKGCAHRAREWLMNSIMRRLCRNRKQLLGFVHRNVNYQPLPKRSQ